MRRPLGWGLRRLLLFAVLKPSDPFLSRSGKEPYSYAWVYECAECHEKKRFRKKQRHPPLCHERRLMELVRSPEDDE
jgi:cytochrome c553